MNNIWGNKWNGLGSAPQITSEFFRQQQKSGPMHQCTRCADVKNANIMFYWTKCDHCYCVECTIQIINESLSMLNQIPKCIHPKCNQSLDILHAQSIPLEQRGSLLPKYKISRGNMHSVSNYNRIESLVAGYVRITSRCNYFPVDVAMMVFDYFNFVHYTKTKCHLCRSRGYENVDCQQCSALGYTTDCKVCSATGVFTQSFECTKCDGSGDFVKIHQCRKCGASGVYAPGACRRCNGTGRYRDIGRCHGCDGTGQFRRTCNNCNGTGQYRFEARCNRCDGNGCIVKRKECRKCKGCGERKARCTHCCGRKQVQSPCRICSGNKVTMALDFNKLRNKQSLCMKCGLYFPNDMIIYWSVCNHVYCMDCIGSEITTQNDTQKRVPICIANECEWPLALERFNSIPYVARRTFCFGCNHYVLIQSIMQWSSCHHSVCRKCAMVHAQREISANRIPICLKHGCDSELSVKEMKTMDFCSRMAGYRYSHSSRSLKILFDHRGKFQCSHCREWHNDWEQIQWSNECGHKYDWKCMTELIDAAIPREKPMFGLLTWCSIPKCVVSKGVAQCSQELSVSKATEVGATDYQIKTLDHLVSVAAKESNSSKDGCIVQ